MWDRDRSKHYYCDPMLYHNFNCNHSLSLLEGPNASIVHEFSCRFPPNLISHYLIFDNLVVTYSLGPQSLYMFDLTSICCHCCFFIYRAHIPWSPLPFMIWNVTVKKKVGVSACVMVSLSLIQLPRALLSPSLTSI